MSPTPGNKGAVFMSRKLKFGQTRRYQPSTDKIDGPQQFKTLHRELNWTAFGILTYSWHHLSIAYLGVRMGNSDFPHNQPPPGEVHSGIAKWARRMYLGLPPTSPPLHFTALNENSRRD